MFNECYTEQFYEQLREGSARSAAVVVPLVLALLPARSVVDVGCGEGAWLAAFRRCGVEDVLGIDGNHVSARTLQIPQERFRAADLCLPLSLDRTFDLAVSLEVAEHLPVKCGAQFVESLTRLAPAVLFSAAIPFQGGMQHVNEQWLDQWAELFERHGYVPVDAIRRRVWQNQAVETWYAQNTLLFVQPALLDGNSTLRTEFERTSPDQLCLVHPRLYLSQRAHLDSLYREALWREAELRAHPASGVKQASRILWQCIRNAISVRFQPTRRRPAAAGHNET